MDINFNGTIITLFGSLPLEMLGSQGGAGSGPSRLDVSCSEESVALAMGTCHSAKGEVVVLGGGGDGKGGRKRRPPPHTHSAFDLLTLETVWPISPFTYLGTLAVRWGSLEPPFPQL